MTKVSVIVPFKNPSKYFLQKTLPALKKQTYKDFEVIIIPDKKDENDYPEWIKVLASGKNKGPAEKRDLAAKKAEGKILAFIDDDAYPQKDWLEKALENFSDQSIAGICGPGLTPEDDDIGEKVSGWVWKTPLGAGGAGIYRCHPTKKCFVDDYPTFNLFIRKKDFAKLGGFDSKYWPGEDTKLCCELVYSLNKKIAYDPEVVVYHHRRKIFAPHLKQISSYGRQRGYFAKIFPKTSNRLGYWVPVFFTIGFFGGGITYFIYPPLFFVYSLVLLVYVVLLVLTFIQVWRNSKNILIGLLTIPAIFLTHIVYGIKFLQGFFFKKVQN